MSIWEALILGVVQGLTEFLPVSSSGHLRALRHLMEFEDGGLTFDVLLHVATLFAVLLYFRRDLVEIVTGKLLLPITLRLGIATVPIFLFGYLLESRIENLSAWAVVGSWTLSGVALLCLSRLRRGTARYTDLSLRQAGGIGLVQTVALLPGVSRSGATILAGILLGLERTQAARFSFLLAIPAILGAGGYKVLKLIQAGTFASNMNFEVAVGMGTAFVVGLVAIYWLLRIVRSNGFHLFGWYNLAAAAAFAAYLLQSSRG